MYASHVVPNEFGMKFILNSKLNVENNFYVPVQTVLNSKRKLSHLGEKDIKLSNYKFTNSRRNSYEGTNSDYYVKKVDGKDFYESGLEISPRKNKDLNIDSSIKITINKIIKDE